MPHKHTHTHSHTQARTNTHTQKTNTQSRCKVAATAALLPCFPFFKPFSFRGQQSMGEMFLRDPCRVVAVIGGKGFAHIQISLICMVPKIAFACVCVCEQGFSLCVCSFIEIQGFVFLTCFYAKHSNKYYTILPTDMQIANHPYLLSIRHFATPTLSLSTETDKSRLGFFAIQSFATNIKA